MENPTKMDEIHGKFLLKWMRFMENPTKMDEIHGKSY